MWLWLKYKYIKFICFITIISLEQSSTSIPSFFCMCQGKHLNFVRLAPIFPLCLFLQVKQFSYFLWTIYIQTNLIIINLKPVHIKFGHNFLILMYVLSLALPYLLCFLWYILHQIKIACHLYRYFKLSKSYYI